MAPRLITAPSHTRNVLVVLKRVLNIKDSFKRIISHTLTLVNYISQTLLIIWCAYDSIRVDSNKMSTDRDIHDSIDYANDVFKRLSLITKK
jgi:hypothetical protein